MNDLLMRAEQLAKKTDEFNQDLQRRTKTVIYVAGPMSGMVNENRESFFAMESKLKASGFIVLNPAVLPQGLSQSQYMDIDLAMLRSADVLCLLDGWQHSPGAVTEYHLAYKLGMNIVMEDQIEKIVDGALPIAC